MSQEFRDQITREDLLDAIAALDRGESHQFGRSTSYDIVHDGQRYAPKAVVGLAARRVLGRPLRPDEFSGGQDQWAFRLLRERGFTIDTKDGAQALPEAPSVHVWIEETNTSEHGHGGEGWEFGTCLWSPSTFAGGSDSYALMREPVPDDLVIHSDNGVFVGWSRISTPYREVTQVPPLAGRWAGRPSYYRIDLKDYRTFPHPVATKEFVAKHHDAIQQEIAAEAPARYPFILYGTDKHVRKAQGAYLSRCTPPLYDLLRRATASETSPSSVGEGRFWAMALGEGGRLWDESQEQGIASLGWDESNLGDLKRFASREAIQEALTALRGPGAPAPSNDALALYQFSQEMAVGDYIVVKAGRRRLLGVGQITSDYYYDETRAEHRHCRRVRWLNAHRAELPVDLALPLKTLTIITHEGLIDFIQDQYFRSSGVAVVSPTAYSIDQALDSLFMSRDLLRAILTALTRKKNVILQGPPGVGKSYAARRIAYAYMEEEDPSRVEMIQFHQSYAYEDFVQGWRPKEEGGFRLRNGTFVEFCNRARIDGTRKYVFIIDEINRGNLSKILGELMLLIEADKRGAQHAIPLTYSESDGERFSVPENVYILGMMNTADRSLALVDYALRRRFVFFAIPPSLESENFAALLRGAGATQELVDTIRLRVGSLNQQIAADPDLGEGFSVGHSYFCPAAGDGAVGLDWYKTVIDTEVGPLLREYWFDKKQTEIEAIIFKLREGI